MKPKFLWGAISIFILLASAAFTPPVPEGPLPEQNTSTASSQPNPLTSGNFLATISPVQGEIYWRQQTEKDWFTINNQQGLDTGNQILTKAEGRAKIEYFDGIIVRVGPHTLFTVTEQTQTEDLNLISRIRLMMGQIFIKHGEGYYQGKFEVETPSGLAAVKGTMMSVQTNAEGQTLVTCLEGICSLSNDSGELTLTEGQGARIDGEGQPPQPAEIEDWQLNDWIENDPDALSIVLRLGLIIQDPELCDPANDKNCIIKHAATLFVGCDHTDTCVVDEDTKPDSSTLPALAVAQPAPDIPALPGPPEIIIPPEDPVIPAGIIEPPPEPEEPLIPHKIGRCPCRRCH
jgi:hypothetical protein